MKTLNTLINEQNISENVQAEQPINESAALIAGLFGALAMGIGALFKGAKKAWEKADEPSKEDETKAKDNEKNMDDSTKAAYDNAMDELDDRNTDNVSEESKEQKKELEEAKEQDSKSRLDTYKSGVKKLLEKDDETVKNDAYVFVYAMDELRKLSEEAEDEEGLELAKKLRKKVEDVIGEEGIQKERLGEKLYRVRRCYLSQIAVNASKAYSEDKKKIGALKDLLGSAAAAAKKKLDKEKGKKSKSAGSDLGLETMIDYVIKVALGLSSESLENELFLKLIDDITFVSAVEVLIGATMIINANPKSKEKLETYQKLFNTLGLQIQLSGK